MKEPEQVIGTVEMVSVEWIMQNLIYSADECHDENDEIDLAVVLDEKIWDGSFPHLVYTIETKGFRVPICLYQVNSQWGLGNGHHRFSAAILMVLDKIPVYWSDYDYMSSHTTDTEELDRNPDWQEWHTLLQDVFR